jgi:hypothetical protein
MCRRLSWKGELRNGGKDVIEHPRIIRRDSVEGPNNEGKKRKSELRAPTENSGRAARGCRRQRKGRIISKRLAS